MDKQRFWGFLAHTSIIVGMMFVIFFVIDRFNPAMEFLSSSISKWLILVFAVCSILNGMYSAVFLFQKQKRHEEKRGSALAKTMPGQNHASQPRLAQPQYDSRGYVPRQRVQPEYGYTNGYAARQPRPTDERQYRRPAAPADKGYSDLQRRDPHTGR